jgi:hypothetical protein
VDTKILLVTEHISTAEHISINRTRILKILDFIIGGNKCQWLETLQKQSVTMADLAQKV